MYPIKSKNFIEGKKVVLKPIQEEDTDRVIYWRNQPFVRDKFIFQDLFTPEIHKSWLQTMVKSGKVCQFIIKIQKGTETFPIGSVYLRDIDRNNHKAELGIFIGEEECIGKGFGSDAVNTILKYGFRELGLHKILLRVFASNKRAIASYRKIGFKIEGYFKDEIKVKGSFQDIIFMAIFNRYTNL